jgi:hypothetical protein
MSGANDQGLTLGSLGKPAASPHEEHPGRQPADHEEDLGDSPAGVRRVGCLVNGGCVRAVVVRASNGVAGCVSVGGAGSSTEVVPVARGADRVACEVQEEVGQDCEDREKGDDLEVSLVPAGQGKEREES